MIEKLIDYFVGYGCIYVKEQDSKRTVMLFYDKGIKYKRNSLKRDNCRFDVSINNLEKAREILSISNIEILKIDTRGAIERIKKYKYRPGVLLGIIVLLFSLFASRMFIWNITVTGNDNVSTEKTMALLEDHGIYIGAFKPSIDLHKIYNEILIENEDYCWISVNIRGTVANVEVRESEKPLKLSPDKNKYANLISEYEGEIAYIESYSGIDCVKVGDAVKAGELLVSGIYEDKLGKTQLTYAQGKVYAKIWRTFIIEVPLEYDKRLYSDTHSYDLDIKIFSKTINILNNSRNLGQMYDIIEENEQLCIFDCVYLPIQVKRTVYNKYTLIKAQRDEQTAQYIAYERFNRELIDFVGDGEILSKQVDAITENDVLYLKAQVYLIKNIAKTQEFVFNEG